VQQVQAVAVQAQSVTQLERLEQPTQVAAAAVVVTQAAAVATAVQAAAVLSSCATPNNLQSLLVQD
jgi:hypothetical protein